MLSRAFCVRDDENVRLDALNGDFFSLEVVVGGVGVEVYRDWGGGCNGVYGYEVNCASHGGLAS